MQKSQYTLFYPVDEWNNNYLAYNTLFRTAALISSQVKKLVEDDTNKDNIPLPLKDKLLKLGILVANKEDDLKKLRNIVDTGYNPGYFFPVIAYTAKCNLRCVYCFEEEIDRSVSMKPEVATQTVKWMRDYILENGPFSRLHLGLFGGEPLLDIKTANYFIDESRIIADELEMEFVFNLTTNGILMKREIISEFAKKGLAAVQVTLDGPPKIHDKRRKFNNGKGTFKLILKNLLDISDIDQITISLEVNIDKQNIDYFGELLDILDQNGLRDRLRLVPELTLETPSCIGIKDHHCNKYTMKQKEVIEGFIKVLKEVSRHKFHIPEIIGISYPCIFVERHHYVIDFYGNIYKCSFTIGNQDFVVGNIFKGFNWKNEDMLSSKNVIDICYEKKCSYIPICGGGCRYTAWIDTGSYHDLNCNKDILDDVLPLSLRQYFTGNCTPFKLD